jgi:predicted Zn-dependent protease
MVRKFPKPFTEFITEITMRILFLVLFVSLLTACATVPITGRQQLSLIPSSSLMSMSYQQYGDFLKTNKLSSYKAKTDEVKQVGARIQGAVERYFQQVGQSDQLQGYQWEFNLVENKEVNAWCMPGGKVVVYSGILPVAKGEPGLAVVMGHEIAHAIAGHGSERMSQEMLAQFGGAALSTAMSQQPEQTRQLWMSVYGVGAQYGALLPYGRLQESEADRLGLIFMAMAGYDPHEAVTFWERMASMKGGQKSPEFLSTHPSDATRIAEIEKLIPEAMGYYAGTPAGSH